MRTRKALVGVLAVVGAVLVPTAQAAPVDCSRYGYTEQKLHDVINEANAGGPLSVTWQVKRDCSIPLAYGLPNVLPNRSLSLSVQGGKITIDLHGRTGRIFRVEGDLALDNVILNGGAPSRNDENGIGGAILNTGTIRLTRTTVARSVAPEAGGGIHNLGIAMLIDSEVVDNSCQRNGCGIFNAGTIELRDTKVSRNKSTGFAGGSGGWGAGIYNGPTGAKLTLVDSEVSDNRTFGSASAGAGLYNNHSQVVLVRSNVTGNRSRSGGGIETVGGSVTLKNSQVIENEALGADGGGIWSAGTQLRLEDNSLVLGNKSAGSGAGINLIDEGTLELVDSAVTGNTAQRRTGGGVHAKGHSTVTLLRTSITGNTAKSQGGGIFLDNNLDNVTLTLDPDSKIADNQPDQCASIKPGACPVPA